MFNTPILFLIFNRPDTTVKVFERIRRIRPRYLFIAADGPRSDKEGESEVCALTRKTVLDSIDWNCEVKTLFRDENLGCGRAVSEAITWFYSIVEEGIILEDDCLPNDSFFHFCEAMLLRYKNDDTIWHITGSCYTTREGVDYFYSKIPFIWGWATWKRAWSNYNFHLFHDSLQDREITLFKNLQSNSQTSFWLERFADLERFGFNFTWDYQWFYTIWKSDGYTIAPTKNLVSNIGFSSDATHTTETGHFLANKPTEEYKSLSFDKFIKFSKERDSEIFKYYFLGNNTNSNYNKALLPIKEILYKFIRKALFKFIPELKQFRQEKIIIDSSIDNKAKVHGKFEFINSRVGSYSYISNNCILNNTLIGKFSSIGPNLVSGLGIHPLNGISTSPMFYSTAKQNGSSLTDENKIEETKPIIIGNDVFIGMNVTILDGVTIGDGAVIGAGAIVSKDIPPYAVAYGNPIKVVKYRFSDSTIKRLLETKWWDWDYNKLNKVEEDFFEVDKFLNCSITSK